MPPDNELVETSRRRIEQQKQAQQLQQILGCIADGKGTVDAQQARMAAQLAGVSLPDGALKPAAGADSPRVSVRPLVSAVLPKQQGAKPPQASPRQRSEKPVYNLAAVLGDGGEIDPAVRRAWEYFSGRLKENFDLIGILFRRADEDSSGKLSRFELHKMLHEMDRTPGIADKDRHRTISKLIDLADIDGDGEINYKEFLQFLKAGVPGQAELQKAREDAPVDAATAELRQAHALVSKRIQERFGGVGGLTAAFRSIDEDKSGSLTLYELKQFLFTMNLVPEMVAPEAVAQLVQTCDRSGDGEVDYAEFTKMMTSETIEELHAARRAISNFKLSGAKRTEEEKEHARVRYLGKPPPKKKTGPSYLSPRTTK